MNILGKYKSNHPECYMSEEIITSKEMMIQLENRQF